MCIVTLPRNYMSPFTTRLKTFVTDEIDHLEEVLLECQQDDPLREYKLF